MLVLKNKEDFTYKIAAYYPSSDMYLFYKIENGTIVDLEKNFNRNIVHSAKDIFCLGFSPEIAFDKDLNHFPSEFLILKDIIRNNIDPRNIHLCEDVWNKGNIDFTEGLLLPYVQFKTEKIEEIESILCKINNILFKKNNNIHYINPHLNCLHSISDFYGFHSTDDFMIAIIKEFDDGIHLYGVMF